MNRQMEKHPSKLDHTRCFQKENRKKKIKFVSQMQNLIAAKVIKNISDVYTDFPSIYFT